MEIRKRCPSGAAFRFGRCRMRPIKKAPFARKPGSRVPFMIRNGLLPCRQPIRKSSEEEVPDQQDCEERNAHQPENKSASHGCFLSFIALNMKCAQRDFVPPAVGTSACKGRSRTPAFPPRDTHEPYRAKGANALPGLRSEASRKKSRGVPGLSPTSRIFLNFSACRTVEPVL